MDAQCVAGVDDTKPPPALGAAVGGLSIDYRPILELKPDPKNPRKHSPKQIRQIADSIRQFGFVCPILVDADASIIAGHGRLQAARQLGMTTVPVVQVDHLTPAQVKALRIADNKLTENGEWDQLLLGEAFQELSLLEVDFSLGITGFDLPEIDLTIQSLSETESSEQDEADDVPETAATAVSKAGDLWQLGQPPSALRQRARHGRLPDAARRRAGGLRPQRSAVQCPHSRARVRQRRRPASRVCDGLRRDVRVGVHRTS